MSTATRPRPRASTAQRTMTMSAEDRLAALRKRITVAKRQITTIKSDADMNRSTRDQRAMRKAAEAFYELDKIVAGRE